MFRDLYRSFVEFLRTFGALQLFFLRLLANSPTILVRRPGLVVQQVYNAGALSLVIIMICGFFVGGVLGLQGYANLAKFNAEDSVGTFAAFSLLKELGPVITALLFSGRAGTALASEIGLMKATEQLSAMEMMAVNPLRRILVPRFLGGVISMPMLTAIFSVIGLFGAHLDKGPASVVKDYIDKEQFSFPSLLDTEGTVEKLYPSFTIPFTYVIDRSGRVVARVDGAKNWESGETFSAVEYLLNNS